MELGGIHHINIRCTPGDLSAIETFYGQVLGLKKGFRPAFPNAGIWLYHDDHPLIHVSARCAEGFLKQKHNGSVDHVAFRATGAADFAQKLRTLGIAFEEQNVAHAGYQIFLHDPVGTLLEFNFANAEAPAALASGSLAPRQTETAA